VTRLASIDVAVVGDGPAGSALAQALTRRGVKTVLFGADRRWDATYTSWSDDLDDVALVDGADIWMHRFESVAVNLERSSTVQRAYGVIDNDALRTVLRRGVEHRLGTVASAADTGARTVVDATGWPSGLDRSDRVLLERDEISWQTALGVVLPHPPPGPLGSPTIMDFSEPPVSGEVGVPTFAYAFPVADGWLIEETVLAGPAIDPELLAQRLASRLGEPVEPLLDRATRIERVRIPMGVPIPPRLGRGAGVGACGGAVRFGATGGMIHPATGYSVASSLRAADRVAEAAAEVLQRGGQQDDFAGVRAIAEAVWPASLRRTRRLHDFGLEVLLGMDAADIRSFFQTFFELPTDRWAAYLRIDTPPGELARVMTSMFVRADWRLRRQLVTGNPRSLLGVFWP
jgi:lycopene beta-cyclase